MSPVKFIGSEVRMFLCVSKRLSRLLFIILELQQIVKKIFKKIIKAEESHSPSKRDMTLLLLMNTVSV